MACLQLPIAPLLQSWRAAPVGPRSGLRPPTRGPPETQGYGSGSPTGASHAPWWRRRRQPSSRPVGCLANRRVRVLSHEEEFEERVRIASETAERIDLYVELLYLEAVDRVVVEYFDVSVGWAQQQQQQQQLEQQQPEQQQQQLEQQQQQRRGRLRVWVVDEERREQLQRPLLRQQRRLLLAERRAEGVKQRRNKRNRKRREEEASASVASAAAPTPPGSARQSTSRGAHQRAPAHAACRKT